MKQPKTLTIESKNLLKVYQQHSNNICRISFYKKVKNLTTTSRNILQRTFCLKFSLVSFFHFFLYCFCEKMKEIFYFSYWVSPMYLYSKEGSKIGKNINSKKKT